MHGRCQTVRSHNVNYVKWPENIDGVVVAMEEVVVPGSVLYWWAI